MHIALFKAGPTVSVGICCNLQHVKRKACAIFSTKTFVLKIVSNCVV